MFVILPDQVDPGISSIEAIITTDLVKQLMGTLKVKAAHLKIKFNKFLVSFIT